MNTHNPLIQVERLSKSYAIEHASQSFKEAVSRGAASLFTRSKSGVGASREIANLFSNISFEARPGDAIAILGPNGTGKSTLLKIISRILPPTSGRAIIHGRLAAMLEVGTGFHPDLTGRENVYLAASILGMTPAQTSERFDAIAAFSGVERHLDTPVKHYSSGMYVRLAFSVAAHCEPEILIVDEVLAVGDAEFKLQSLAKIIEIRDAGVAILFISHDPALVHAVATKTLDISTGTLRDYEHQPTFHRPP